MNSNSKCTDQMSIKEEFCAMAVVFLNGKILTTNEMIFGREAVSLPKGHVEENEAFLETAIRECFEETNIVLSHDELVRELKPYSYEFSRPNDEAALIRKTIVPFLFEAKRAGEPMPKEERVLSVQWMEVNDFLEKCSYENVKTLVKSIL